MFLICKAMSKIKRACNLNRVLVYYNCSMCFLTMNTYMLSVASYFEALNAEYTSNHRVNQIFFEQLFNVVKDCNCRKNLC